MRIGVGRRTSDLDIPMHIETVPTVREADGLALSSRNRDLLPRRRAIAPAPRRVPPAAR
ncbi:MAG TPA: pantoate--beta-alanine ligase [Stellaceae bacterium]|nr:pantoate--beta-alanine ligase [Stellaceae bacterium]